MKTSAAPLRRLFAVLLAITMTGAVLSFGSTAYAADVATVPLGTSVNYSVLGGSTVTNTGASVLNASLGLSPGTSITGFPPGLVNAPGTTDIANPAAQQAQVDLTAAYVNAAGRPINATTTADLANLTLVGGVYSGPSKSPLSLTGPLVLDGAGNNDTVFIFQTDSTLTTASSSTITLINGAQECNVFWQVGSSATLGTGSVFAGNILALSSITVTTGVTVHGRALARNAAVTLDNDTFTVPTCANTITGGRQAPPTTTPPEAPVAQPGTPTGQLGVPPTSLAFTGPRIVLPLVLALMFLTLGAVALTFDRSRQQRTYGPTLRNRGAKSNELRHDVATSPSAGGRRWLVSKRAPRSLPNASCANYSAIQALASPPKTARRSMTTTDSGSHTRRSVSSQHRLPTARATYRPRVILPGSPS